MKNQYKTTDICKMFDLSLDALRYYEKLGLIQTQRNEHYFRSFTLSDLYRFAMIRDLRMLSIPIPLMKQQLQHQNIQAHLLALQEEELLLDQQLQELEALKKRQQLKIAHLTQSTQIEIIQPTLRTYPQRTCLILQDTHHPSTLQKKASSLGVVLDEVLSSLDCYTIGCLINTQDLFNIKPSKVFIIDEQLESYDLLLPPGAYLSMYCRGAQAEQRCALTYLLAYCIEHQLQIDNVILAISIIHEVDTQDTKEYLTQFQIKIKESECP